MTALHVPGEPDTSHASHAPPHAPLQQTPSTHNVLWHCEFALHALLLGRAAVQLPLTQYGAEDAQSGLAVQVVKQAVPLLLQTRFPGQALAAALAQLPAPLHADADVSVEPTQLCARHAASLPGNVQV